ncbi:hypothetical protein AB0L00_14700 [Actinoallomurus sp. NPDC052308]|uniref:hypothetical protein n=1 Tax=Actinoallomurus sp. NPDC052308 TaxID=3155530 RepID=UPI0034324F5B
MKPLRAGDPRQERESAIDHAIRIARSIDDHKERENALFGVAMALAEADLDHAERHLQRIPSIEVRALASLALAGRPSDPERIEELLGHADPFIDQLLEERSDSVDHETFESLVGRLIEVDSRRALAVLGRVERLVVGFHDPGADDLGLRRVLRARALAAEADRLAATAPDRAAELMGQAVEAAHMIRPDPDDELQLRDSLLRGTMMKIAKVGYAIDRRHAERLIYLAGASALGVTDEHLRDGELRSTAVGMAEVDPARAERLINKITAASIRASAWEDVLKAAASTGRDHKSLLDAAEESVIPPGQAGSSWDRRRAEPEIGDDQQNGGFYYPYYLGSIAKGAARCDPARAETIASRITDAGARNEAFADMAGEIAEIDPSQARRWLDTAYRTALEVEPRRALPVMGKIAAVGATVCPGTARQAASYIADNADDADLGFEEAQRLAKIAEDVVAVDPSLTMRLIELAGTRAQQRVKQRLDNGDLKRMARTLMAVAAAWADSSPERATRITHQVLEVALAAQPTDPLLISLLDQVVTAYLSISEIAAQKRQSLKRLIRQYHGPSRDHLLYVAVPVFAVSDVRRAEQIAQEIGDDSLRCVALRVLAESIIKQTMGSADQAAGRSSP